MKQRDSDIESLDQQLYQAVLLLKTPEECRDFFADLCTPAEMEALADRWNVAQKLALGLPYRSIHDQTGVSVATITRVARFLFNGNGGYKKIIERLK